MIEILISLEGVNRFYSGLLICDTIIESGMYAGGFNKDCDVGNITELLKCFCLHEKDLEKFFSTSMTDRKFL